MEQVEQVFPMLTQKMWLKPFNKTVSTILGLRMSHIQKTLFHLFHLCQSHETIEKKVGQVPWAPCSTCSTLFHFGPTKSPGARKRRG